MITKNCAICLSNPASLAYILRVTPLHKNGPTNILFRIFPEYVITGPVRSGHGVPGFASSKEITYAIMRDR